MGSGERLNHERELTGFYITGHPLTRYEAMITAMSSAKTIVLAELQTEGSDDLRHRRRGQSHADEEGRSDGLSYV